MLPAIEEVVKWYLVLASLCSLCPLTSLARRRRPAAATCACVAEFSAEARLPKPALTQPTRSFWP